MVMSSGKSNNKRSKMCLSYVYIKDFIEHHEFANIIRIKIHIMRHIYRMFIHLFYIIKNIISQSTSLYIIGSKLELLLSYIHVMFMT